MPANVWNVYPGDDAYDFYYKNNDNIYGYTFASDTKDKLVDWMACDVDTSNMYDSGMLSDGRTGAATRPPTSLSSCTALTLPRSRKRPS